MFALNLTLKARNLTEELATKLDALAEGVGSEVVLEEASLKVGHCLPCSLNCCSSSTTVCPQLTQECLSKAERAGEGPF